jgi:hypothetical protein
MLSAGISSAAAGNETEAFQGRTLKHFSWLIRLRRGIYSVGELRFDLNKKLVKLLRPLSLALHRSCEMPRVILNPKKMDEALEQALGIDISQKKWQSGHFFSRLPLAKGGDKRAHFIRDCLCSQIAIG